jgi:serine O-acetyltransferase
MLRTDIQNILNKDPAAKSFWHVLFCYPGLHAILLHRPAHFFYHRSWYLLAGLMAALARFLTGIEIHPGATIGNRVFIDHGMGVVIGETAIVGDDCTIYQGVTLGGTSLEAIKRHPTLEQGVTVSSGAKILGNINMGAYAKIGANAVVLHDIPAGETAVGVPAKVLYKAAQNNPNHNPKPDLKLEQNSHQKPSKAEYFTPYCPDQSNPLEVLEQQIQEQELRLKKLEDQICQSLQNMLK